MLTGEFKYSLDEKGRLMVPARMRAEIVGNILVLTRGIEQCIWLFQPDEWKKITSNLIQSTSLFQEKARLIHRRIIAPAQEVEIDRSGRIMVPPSLREYAELQKDCVILSMIKHIEIWNEENYKGWCDVNEDKFRDAFEELGDKISF